jgi:TonB family protein
MSPPLWFADFLSYCLQVFLLVAVGTALPALFRLRSPRVLLAYWQGLLVICLVLPVLQPWRPPAVASSLADGAVSISFQGVPAGAEESHFSLYIFIAGVLLAGMLVRLAWLALGLNRLRAIRRTAHVFDPRPHGIVELESRLRVTPAWYLAPKLESPATFGIRPPSILLPERFPTMDEAFQRAIAGHELLHVARRDWIFNLGEELILTVFWFHPAVAWVVNRIRLSREQTVDAEAVRLVSARKPYMSALLEIASGGAGPALGAAPTFLREHQLVQRIELLVKEVTMSKPRLFFSLIAIIGLLILAGGVGVWAFPLRAPVQAASAGNQQAEKETPPYASAAIQPVKQVAVVYPPAAKKAGIQGKVRLRVSINPDGSVMDMRPLTGDPLLMKAALEAVRQWRYLPSEDIRVMVVTISFTLAKGGADVQAQQASGGALPHTRTSPNVFTSSKGGGVRGGVYTVGNGVSAPIPIYQPEPSYTKEARAAKLQGTVTLWIVVGVDGTVADAKAINAFDKGLAENAVQTVKTWKFAPAMKAGKPVPCRLEVEVSFRLF